MADNGMASLLRLRTSERLAVTDAFVFLALESEGDSQRAQKKLEDIATWKERIRLYETLIETGLSDAVHNLLDVL